MKKLVSILGILGMLLFTAFSIIDRIFMTQDRTYYICTGAAFLLCLPLLIREILSLRKEKK